MSEIAVQQTVYLITGANKGIGRAIVEILLQRPDTIVVAGVRFPNDPTCTSLRELHTGKGSKAFVVELREDKHYKALGETLKSQGIDHLDVVIANAGTSKGFYTVVETPLENVISDFEVNTIGTMKLFQTCWPLYRPKHAQGGKPRKWIVVTSSLGSIGCLDMESMPCASYGLSKAAVNFMTKKIAVEMKDENLAAMCIHPGWVNTEMGRKLAQSLGAPDPALTPEDSARGCLDYIDNLTIETTGKFLYYDGRELPW